MNSRLLFSPSELQTKHDYHGAMPHAIFDVKGTSGGTIAVQLALQIRVVPSYSFGGPLAINLASGASGLPGQLPVPLHGKPSLFAGITAFTPAPQEVYENLWPVQPSVHRELSPGNIVFFAGPESPTSEMQKQPAWDREVIHELNALTALPTNWDRQGGNAVHAAHALRTLAFLHGAMRPDTPAPTLVPVSDGGLQLEWHEGGLDIEVLFDPEGNDELYFHDLATGEEREGPAAAMFLEEDLARRLEGVVANVAP